LAEVVIMGEEVGMNGRLARWSGFAFVVLLLLQAGMADIPTLDTPIDRIQRFYASHGMTIVAAQIVSVAASFAAARAEAQASSYLASRPESRRAPS